MPGTVLTYLDKFGNISFSEHPLNDVDSLILSQFSYLKFDGMVPVLGEGKPAVCMDGLVNHPDFERLFADERFEKDNRAMFQRMVNSTRYHGMKMNFFVNVVEKEWETQFSAITFFLDDGSIYVAFRGTDETLVGWKEDFNMAFLSPVPGQKFSERYLTEVAELFDGPFYVGGHSKGGNLAVYSAMCAKEAIQDRIIKVYCMDGPGFREEVLKEKHYERIAPKVEKILPHSSVVGMLLQRDTNYKVVESKNIGLAQHDPFSWIVRNNEFVDAKAVYEGRRIMNEAINDWVLSLKEDQLRTIVNTLYTIVQASKAEDLIAMMADKKKSINGMLEAMKEVDKETQKAIWEIIKLFFEVTRERTRTEAKETLQRITAKNAAKGGARREKSSKRPDVPDATGLLK